MIPGSQSRKDVFKAVSPRSKRHSHTDSSFTLLSPSLMYPSDKDTEPDQQTPQGNQQVLGCAEHMKAQEAFCRTCGVPVCILCLIKPVHKQHRVESLETAMQQEKKNLGNLRAQIASQLQRLQTEMEANEVRLLEEKIGTEKALKGIRTWAGQLKGLIDKQVAYFEERAAWVKQTKRADADGTDRR